MIYDWMDNAVKYELMVFSSREMDLNHRPASPVTSLVQIKIIASIKFLLESGALGDSYHLIISVVRAK